MSFLRTDERQEFISSLFHSAELSERIAGDATYWKWFIIAYHNALQALAVCYLAGSITGMGTSGVGIMKENSDPAKDSVRQMLAYFQGKRDDPPVVQLASFLDLFKRLRCSEYVGEAYVVKPSRAVSESLKKLNAYRNDFMHFTPKGWSISFSGFPERVLLLCDLIERLAISQPTFERHLVPEDSSRIESALAEIRTNFRKLNC